MKKLFTFLTFFLLATLVGVTQAAEKTLTMTSFSALSGKVDGDDNIRYSTAQEGSTTAPALYDNQIRLYQRTKTGKLGGSITISVNSGSSAKIKSVTLGSSTETSAVYFIGASNTSSKTISISTNGTIEASSSDGTTSIKFANMGTQSNKTRLNINKLVVVYDDGQPDVPTALAPIFDKEDGRYVEKVTVKVDNYQEDQTYYYSFDTENPTSANTPYNHSTGVEINESNVLYMVAYKEGVEQPSAVTSGTFVIVPPAPTFSNNGGTFTTAQHVTVTNYNENYLYVYTTDGTTPSYTPLNGKEYEKDEVLDITGPCTLNMVAVNNGNELSDVTSAVFDIYATTPTLTPANGTFFDSQVVKVAEPIEGYTYYYTTDGSDPSNGEEFDPATGVTLTKSCTLKVIARDGDGVLSRVASGDYTIKAVAPVFTPEPGKYGEVITVKVSDDTYNDNYLYYYTLDGSEPTEGGNDYDHNAGILINETSTLKMVAVGDGDNSDITSGEYVISIFNGVEITGEPKTQYYVGKDFDLASLKVIAKYSDGDVDVTDDENTTISADPASFTATGSYTVTVNATYNGTVAEPREFLVNVTEAPKETNATILWSGNGGNNDGGKIGTQSKILEYTTDEEGLVSEFDFNAVYSAKKDFGLRLGTKSGSGSITTKLNKTVKLSKLVVRASDWVSTKDGANGSVLSVYVNGEKQEEFALSEEFDNYEIELPETDVNSITVSSNISCYLKSLTLTILSDEPAAESKTLKDIVDGGKTGNYTISNDLVVAKKVEKAKVIFVKDDNKAQQSTKKEGQEDYLISANGNETPQANYNHSNWLELTVSDDVFSAVTEGDIIKGGSITGKYTDALNPSMTLSSTALETVAGTTYNPNVMVPANFIEQNEYFFVTPQNNELVQLCWAVYVASENAFFCPKQNGTFNRQGIAGKVKLGDFRYNDQQNVSLADGTGYEFQAIVKHVKADAAPRKVDDKKLDPQPTNGVDTDYEVYPINLDPSITTAINGVDAVKAVASVKFYNLQGAQFDTLQDGINIVVTKYTDGTTTAVKIAK